MQDIRIGTFYFLTVDGAMIYQLQRSSP
jgi:hypothetical protein